ncbi:cytochrome c [Novosphingobium chloroacetimidivorans]|uniref:Cytochrome c n=1 Tax=Novosphingobium chloroacetimidivorans TaxID=1428314 RepID=A0A7W7NVV0_9SPHN|nr:c-type cytochrome [Novosphingobium chloroacetimidivorans]MBB4858666.1 cytochrome c [Novosphingobium chloroacetimidivorans]
MRFALILPALLLATSPAIAAQPDGRQVFTQACAVCHADPAKADASPRIGPSLKGVVGRRAASDPKYTRYSAAMKKSGKVWDKATLSSYLASPRAVVPGTTMTYGGLADPARRAALIDYLSKNR